jgi:predicted Zn-dependent protease
MNVDTASSKKHAPGKLRSARANVLHRSLALLLALAQFATPLVLPSTAQAASALPALGDAASDDLTVAAEKRLGDRIMLEIRRDPDVIDDPLLLDYVAQTFEPLLASARARGEISEDLQGHFNFETFLVRDRSVNAFALPGGHIGVHLGLLSMTGSRDELAAVLAHELSHVTQRHIARMVAVNRRQSLIGIASFILGVMAASRSPDAANALIMGGQGVAAQGQLNFSRDMEREADRVGFGVLEGAGYAGVGMVGMFERLQQSSRLDTQQFPYLRSHPLTGERIGEARQRLGVIGAGTSLANNSGGEQARWLHAAMQGRARALMDNRNETLQRLAGAALTNNGQSGAGVEPSASGNAESNPEALANAYAAALAASRLKNWAAADNALRRALALSKPYDAADRAVEVLAVETLIDRGRASDALALLRNRLDDGSRASLLLAARAVLAATGPQAGPLADIKPRSDALQTWVALHPDDAGAWQALGLLLERRGQPLAALRAHAEVQLAYGDLAGAADRLRAGQRIARSSGQAESVDAAVIDARLTAVELRRRREQAEDRQGGGEPRLSLGLTTGH